MVLSIVAQPEHPLNPMGIESFSLGLARVREGREMVSFIVAQPELPLNSIGIASFSLGLARVREGLPKVAAGKNSNPERVEDPCV